MTEKQAIRTIMEYESDTFDASYWKVTKMEAKRMLGRIVESAFANDVDGIWLSDMIEDFRQRRRAIREIKKSKCEAKP